MPETEGVVNLVVRHNARESIGEMAAAMRPAEAAARDLEGAIDDIGTAERDLTRVTDQAVQQRIDAYKSEAAAIAGRGDPAGAAGGGGGGTAGGVRAVTGGLAALTGISAIGSKLVPAIDRLSEAASGSYEATSTLFEDIGGLVGLVGGGIVGGIVGGAAGGVGAPPGAVGGALAGEELLSRGGRFLDDLFNDFEQEEKDKQAALEESNKLAEKEIQRLERLDEAIRELRSGTEGPAQTQETQLALLQLVQELRDISRGGTPSTNTYDVIQREEAQEEVAIAKFLNRLLEEISKGNETVVTAMQLLDAQGAANRKNVDILLENVKEQQVTPGGTVSG